MNHSQHTAPKARAHTSSAANDAVAAHRTLDLGSLGQMSSADLARLYQNGSVPADLGVLEGHPRGRMLAIRALGLAPIRGALSLFAGARVFPWGGKSFSGRGAEGRGVNRVHLGGRHQLFPFHTHVTASAVDGKPTIALDYDLADNPWLIRQIHDEIREIEAGLFLGPAMWKSSGGPSHVLWFALDTREQSAPIGE